MYVAYYILKHKLIGEAMNDEQVIITKKAIAPFNVMSPSDRYLYKVGDKVLTPFGIQTIKTM